MTEAEYRLKRRHLSKRLGYNRKVPRWRWWLLSLQWRWYGLKRSIWEHHGKPDRASG
jgi:hypothetical protein